MNPEVKAAFTGVKPVCDLVMVCPSVPTIGAFMERVAEMKPEAVQELQQYILFPLITHIKSEEMDKKYEMQTKMAEAMNIVLDRVVINSFEMCMKIETALLSLVFDNAKTGMVAEVPEELKLTVMQCLTNLMLKLDKQTRSTLLKTQVPTIAQAVFVAVHIAKLDKLRSLRLAAIDCVTAHTCTHRKLTDSNYHIPDKQLELSVVDMLANILPGVLAALQDVATDTHNPGHAVVVAAVDAIHRILCLTMNDKHMPRRGEVTAQDFGKVLREKHGPDKHVSSDKGKQKFLEKLSLEWYKMAGEKIVVVTKSLTSLSIHEHPKVRKELAVLCYRILTECNAAVTSAHPTAQVISDWSHTNIMGQPIKTHKIVRNLGTANQNAVSEHVTPSELAQSFKNKMDDISALLGNLRGALMLNFLNMSRQYVCLEHCRSMQPSISVALDMLLSLSKDDFPDVSEYCNEAVALYMNSSHFDKTTDGLADNLIAVYNSLPRILNNIEPARKVSAINLVHGYTQILCDDSRPQRLTTALSAHLNMQCCCNALIEAATVEPITSMAQYATRNVSAPPPPNSPWCKLRHLDSAVCERRFRETLRFMGNAECADLVVDRLLEMFHQKPDCEIVYIINGICAAENSPVKLVGRVLNTYIEESLWYVPLEVGCTEAPLTTDDTLDVNVYNPRAWTKESVPDLYEGTTETRYTDISVLKPRAPPVRDPRKCATLAEAQRNMVLSCLLTEGVGIVAKRLKENYQPFLLKTLCLILERVGSKYEMLHLAGLKTINAIAAAGGHPSVAHLVAANADYFTHQVTVRLKKSWNSQSALQILSVVMEYSDASIFNCLYGIVEDVLVQSCDRYYERNLDSYLQVFLTFIHCVRKWYPPKQTDGPTDSTKGFSEDVLEFLENQEAAKRLETDEVDDDCGKSVEDMYKEDMQKKEEDILDYDDTVTEETLPPPQHIKVTITILKRCINFITSTRWDECILSLQILTAGFYILKDRPDDLLPLVHQAWAPLVGRFESHEPIVLKRGLDLLVAMAELSKDFIRSRTVREVLPSIYKYLKKSSLESYLKDAGSAYRNSQPYYLQVAILKTLPTLAIDLMLDGERLTEAMACASLYLSKKQPKPLQNVAVHFFKALLNYDYGAAWLYLRQVCDNNIVINPPGDSQVPLEPVIGTPYESTNKDNDENIKRIWDLVEV